MTTPLGPIDRSVGAGGSPGHPAAAVTLIVVLLGAVIGGAYVAVDRIGSKSDRAADPVPVATTTSLPPEAPLPSLPEAEPFDVDRFAAGEQPRPLPPLESDTNPYGQVGTCAPLDSYLPVPCTQEHAEEVLAYVPLDGTDYPGAQVLANAASRACRDYQDLSRSTVTFPSGYLVLAVQPSRTAWQEGAREAVCLVVWFTEEPTTGSVLAGTSERPPAD